MCIGVLPHDYVVLLVGLMSFTPSLIAIRSVHLRRLVPGNLQCCRFEYLRYVSACQAGETLTTPACSGDRCHQ